MTETYPYRVVATEGVYAGTTFVYYPGGLVVTYKTDSPSCFHRTGPDFGTGLPRWSRRWDMTPEKYAEFDAVPLRDLERTVPRA